MKGGWQSERSENELKQEEEVINNVGTRKIESHIAAHGRN